MIKYLLVILMMFLLACCLFYYKYIYTETIENMESVPNGNLVLYSSPGCSHCEIFRPKWNTFREANNNVYNNLTIKTVECDKDIEKCNSEQIEFIPSIVLYKNGKKNMYNGEKDIDKIKEWVNEY